MSGRKTWDVDGEDCGIAQPIRFDDTGSVGYQIVDESGELLGLIDHGGGGFPPCDTGNRTWEVCEETDKHLKALWRYTADGENKVEGICQ